MKVCVTSTGQNLDAPMDPRFGRCQYFVIVDSDSMDFEAIANPSIGAAGGAGAQSAQLVANMGAQMVLTGNVGPNAFRALQAAGIKIVIGISGTVRTVLESLKAGKVKCVDAPSVGAHFGMSRGGGGEMSSGTGRRSGMRLAGAQDAAQSQAAPRSDEVKALREESRRLKKQLDQTEKQIGQMTRRKQG